MSKQSDFHLPRNKRTSYQIGFEVFEVECRGTEGIRPVIVACATRVEIDAKGNEVSREKIRVAVDRIGELGAPDMERAYWDRLTDLVDAIEAQWGYQIDLSRLGPSKEEE